MTAVRDRLPGAWSLVSLRRFRNGVFHRFPMSEGACGRLIYASEGVMSAFLASPEWIRGTAKPDWSAFLAYSGRWRLIHEDTVVHDVDMASIGALIGRPLERYVSFAPDATMMLKTDGHVTSSGEKSHDELIWRRVT
jgi:hypothetical protein